MSEWWNGLSGRQRALVTVAAVADCSLKTVAFIDLKRRPADQVRGPKLLWAGIILINSSGLTSLSYLVYGRRRPSS
jgi:hypothetical protein